MMRNRYMYTQACAWMRRHIPGGVKPLREGENMIKDLVLIMEEQRLDKDQIAIAVNETLSTHYWEGRIP